MTILPKFYDHLCVTHIEEQLASKEQAIDSATCADTNTLNALGWHGGRLLKCLPQEKWPDALNNAKQVARNAQVEAVRATKAKATCSTCKQEFEYFGSIPVKNDRHDKLAKLDVVPATCQPCAWKAYEDGYTQERLDAFFEANGHANFYCSQLGEPPRPAQYAATVGWIEKAMLTDDVGGLVLIGDSFTGKTTAAYHLCKRLLFEHYCDDILAVNSAELNAIPQRIMDGSLTDFMDGLRYADILLIDDLCKVRVTPRIASELWTLFEFRLRGQASPRLTLITMNLRSKRDFIAMFNGKEAESRKIGLSIYNRIEASFDFIDFDAK